MVAPPLAALERAPRLCLSMPCNRGRDPNLVMRFNPGLLSRGRRSGFSDFCSSGSPASGYRFMPVVRHFDTEDWKWEVIVKTRR